MPPPQHNSIAQLSQSDILNPFVDELKRVYNPDVDRRILTPADVEVPTKEQ